MINRKISVCTVALLSALLSAFFGVTAVMAAVTLPSGWYVEGNVGASKAHVSGFDNTGVGGNVNVGYKFIPYFATEAGFTMYGASTLESDGDTIATIKHNSYDLVVKGILPISASGFDLFAKLGWAGVYSSITGSSVDNSSSTANGWYYGLGGDYSFFPNIAGNIQWARAEGNHSTGYLDLYSIGITYLVG